MVFRMRKFIYTADNNIVGLFVSPKFFFFFLGKANLHEAQQHKCQNTHWSENYADRADNNKS